jgi:hypothetical protein
MTTTRSLPLIAAITFGVFAACNYTEGECWYYGEGSENAGAGPGGGVTNPTGPVGVGAYGEGPPPPDSSMPPPECNIVSDGPCYDKCQAEDEARAIECAKIKDEAQRTACVYSSYEKYKSCREGCEQSSNRTCQQKWEDCTNYAPWECAKGNLTKCYQCYEECKSGAIPSPDCRYCGF